MARYYVSAVSYNNHNAINQLLVHIATSDGNTLQRGIKRTEAEVIQLLSVHGNDAYTVVWNYTKAQWAEGAGIHIVPANGGAYLRSTRDLTTRDNLRNLLPLDQLHA